MKWFKLFATLVLVVALVLSANATDDLFSLTLAKIGKWKIWEGLKLKRIGKIFKWDGIFKGVKLALVGDAIASEAASKASSSENVYLFEDPHTGIRVMAVDDFEKENNRNLKISYPMKSQYLKNLQYPITHQYHNAETPSYYKNEQDIYDYEGTQESQLSYVQHNNYDNEDDDVPSEQLIKQVEEFLTEQKKNMHKYQEAPSSGQELNFKIHSDFQQPDNSPLIWYTFNADQQITPLKLTYDANGLPMFENYDVNEKLYNYEEKNTEFNNQSPDLQFHMVEAVKNPQTIDKENERVAQFPNELKEVYVIEKDLDKRSPGKMSQPWMIADINLQQQQQLSVPSSKYQKFEYMPAGEYDQHLQSHHQLSSLNHNKKYDQHDQYELNNENRVINEPNPYIFYNFDTMVAADAQQDSYQQHQQKQYFDDQLEVSAQTLHGYHAINDHPMSQGPAYYSFDEMVATDVPQNQQMYHGFDGQAQQGYRGMEAHAPMPSPSPLPSHMPQPLTEHGYRAMDGAQQYGFDQNNNMQPNEAMVSDPQNNEDVGSFYTGNLFSTNQYNSGFGHVGGFHGKHSKKFGKHGKSHKHVHIISKDYGYYPRYYREVSPQVQYEELIAKQQPQAFYQTSVQNTADQSKFLILPSSLQSMETQQDLFMRSTRANENVKDNKQLDSVPSRCSAHLISTSQNRKTQRATQITPAEYSSMIPSTTQYYAKNSTTIYTKPDSTKSQSSGTTLTQYPAKSSVSSYPKSTQYQGKTQSSSYPAITQYQSNLEQYSTKYPSTGAIPIGSTAPNSFDENVDVGYPLSDRMKTPFFGLLDRNYHNPNHHQSHSYPRNHHSPEYYQNLNSKP